MDVNLNADPEFREMVRAEVKAALIGSTKIEVTDAVQEGIRRAVGNAECKIPAFIQSTVKETISARSWIWDTARQEIRNLVREEIALKIREMAQNEVNKIDIASEVKKKLSNFKISIVV